MSVIYCVGVELGEDCVNDDACSTTNAECDTGSLKCVCTQGFIDTNGINTIDGACIPGTFCFLDIANIEEHPNY